MCASCDPTGARPAGVEYAKVEGKLVGGSGVWPQAMGLAANIPGWTPYFLETALYQSRYLSDSGRLFFNSNDGLVSQDVNGNWDVYQYEPPGVGGCTTVSVTFSERSVGCVGLISSGSSPDESAFLDASETGGDVFFLTKASLVSQDLDTSLDVYDAHAVHRLLAVLPGARRAAAGVCYRSVVPARAVPATRYLRGTRELDVLGSGNLLVPFVAQHHPVAHGPEMQAGSRQEARQVCQEEEGEEVGAQEAWVVCSGGACLCFSSCASW